MNNPKITPDEAGKPLKVRRGARSVAVLSTIIFAAILIALTAYFFSASAQPVKTASAGTPPDVNGLFYKDGDYQTYWPYSESDNGSVLYLYISEPETRVYAALVVTRSFNDLVCSPQADAEYTKDAGWPNHRSCKRGSDSEFASWTLRCTATPKRWDWYQGLAFMDTPYHFVSNNTTGAGLGIAPPGYQSMSSFAANWNNYFTKLDAGTTLWNAFPGTVKNTNLETWKSPYDPAFPISVTGYLPGYPVSGPITFSPVHEYEWAMVYEWSADISVCGPDPLFIITGVSHHSPSKLGPEDDPFRDKDPLLDFGDLPDTYKTLTVTNGAAHIFIVGAPRLGGFVDYEPDGHPSLLANGDDMTALDDGEGVFRDESTSWQNGQTVNITFDVQNCSETADVAMWIDWDNNGTFEADEYYTFLDLACGAQHTVQITVPGPQDYTVGTTLSVRVRIFSDEDAAPGGSLDWGDFAGIAANGEVEDHTWDFGPTAISLTEFSASSPSARLLPILVAALVVLAAAGFILQRKIKV